ncbi:hypothetical protein QYE76_030025 [Lolium multiflorum]|uniref:Uncharacterized protein n=1 Tax=Lolium multiflorum TaxID=4521 RepID=A0AAD8QPN9_LOLMU|nr:hypothetical protein QYE76_030025 [Lolium multiflorum]
MDTSHVPSHAPPRRPTAASHHAPHRTARHRTTPHKNSTHLPLIHHTTAPHNDHTNPRSSSVCCTATTTRTRRDLAQPPASPRAWRPRPRRTRPAPPIRRGPRRTTRRGSSSGRGPRRRPNRLVVDEATNDDNSVVTLHPDTMERLQTSRTLAPPLCARRRPVLSPPASVLLSSKPAAEARGPGVRRSIGSPVLASKPAAEARVSCRGEGVDHGVPPARVEAGDGGARPRRSPWRGPSCSVRQGPDQPDRSAASSRSSTPTTRATRSAVFHPRDKE